MGRVYAFLIDILIVLGLSILGKLILRSFNTTRSRILEWSLSFGLGAGVFTWIMFLLSWGGVRISLKSTLIIFMILTCSLFLLRLRQLRLDFRQNYTQLTWSLFTQEHGLTLISWLLVATLIIFAFILAVTLSYYSWDGIALWGVKGYGIALEGSVLGAAEWGWTGIAFPLNIPLQISLFRIFEGDVLPGSKLIFPIYYTSLLLGSFTFMRKIGVRRDVSVLVLTLAGTTPIFFEHATIAYTNLPFTFYLIFGTLWSMCGLSHKDNRETLLGGLLLALAAWTRPEGILFVVGIFLAMILTQIVHKQINIQIVQFFVPSILVMVPWLIFLSQHYTGTEEYDLSWVALRGVLQGEIYLSALYRILRYAGGQILLFRDFGFLLGIGLPLSLLGLFVKRTRKDPSYLALMSVLIVFIGITVGTLYVFAYSPRGVDYVETMIGQAFNRTLMPAGFLSAILGGYVVSKLWSRENKFEAATTPS